MNANNVLGDFITQGYEEHLISRACTYKDFFRDDFIKYAKALGQEVVNDEFGEHIAFKRKIWEFCFICALLNERKLLDTGKTGLGFAVGEEPLPSYFASQGVKVTATDLSPKEESSRGWANTGQNSYGDMEKLYKEHICSRSSFDRNVDFRFLNMNSIPDNYKNYDFCWSSCAIEHVGSLKKSKDFIKNMLTTIKPGGTAIHTTEFNLSSNDKTVEEGMSVIWRKRDLEEIQEWCIRNGHTMELSFMRGTHQADIYVDSPPYFKHNYHLALYLDGFASTSFSVVITKAE